MCDDTLTLEEEVQLLRYFGNRYREKEQEALTKVLKCLSSSGFLIKLGQCAVLRDLTKLDASTVIKELNGEALVKREACGNTNIESVVREALSALTTDATSFGPQTRKPRLPRPRRSMFV